MMADVVIPKHARLIMVLSFPVFWALLVWFPQAEHIQRESNITALNCLIPAVLPLVIGLPLTIKRFAAMRLFRLYMAIWMGVTIPALLLLFAWVAEFSGRCDYLFYGLGVFAMVVQGVEWCVESVKARRRLQVHSNDAVAQTDERDAGKNPINS